MISRRLYSTTGSAGRLASVIKNVDLLKTKSYINGAWVASSTNKKFDVNDPALYPKPDSKLASVSSMTLQDFERAIDHARVAFDEFKQTSGRYRSNLLLQLYELMIENKNDLATLITLENGKPYADALGEVNYAASFFQWFAEEAPRISGDIIPSADASKRIFALKQPIGVCGILTPWNFPLAMITRKLGAAIAAGCTTVIKPASETPLSALSLGYLVEKAGFPKGVVNILATDDTAAIGKLLCESPIIKKVSFTGSTKVGKLLMNQSSSTLKKLSFELGGNAPFIVFEDADIEKAVAGAVTSKFRSSGQTCICANRIFVHESIYDEFATKFVNKVKKDSLLGYGLNKGVTHGPLIHDRSMQKVVSHIEDAVSKGASILCGGSKRPDLGTNFHELTILGDVTPDMLIFQEETFGPVAPLIKFSSDQEVIKLANDTEVGLAGYFYSTNVSKVFKVAEELEVGMLGVNTGAISEAALPFGGVQESGFGREGSKFGVDDYMVIKGIVLGDIV
ncbi:hypothetical protein KGF56_003293 [Candida oxycetoniae]|uniref:Succinate-semialdehyde dehydrogenase n=1 Tax=Candida oxycetoniae TaxID=497107 RepID=A0AAI9WXA8_9ASCO|nr:uncharacterized protein KGF56_003293 [Candida oxycetoniae]KAI3403863.2 hypothetical protein KGF56_003293 [Candida oxycetoniae]